MCLCVQLRPNDKFSPTTLAAPLRLGRHLGYTHAREELGQAVGRARAEEEELDDAAALLLAEERREAVALACEAHRLADDTKLARAVLRAKGR